MPSHRPSSGQLGQRMSFHSLVALRPDATQSFLAQVAKHLGGNVQLQSGVSSIMVQTAEQKKRLRYKEDLLNNREPPTRTETNRRLLEEVPRSLRRSPRREDQSSEHHRNHGTLAFLGGRSRPAPQGNPDGWRRIPELASAVLAPGTPRRCGRRWLAADGRHGAMQSRAAVALQDLQPQSSDDPACGTYGAAASCRQSCVGVAHYCEPGFAKSQRCRAALRASTLRRPPRPNV